jgi:ATP-binding cassette, subfamily G (WHITE), member 2
VTALLFLWSIMPGYASSACMPALVSERALFVREREDGLYRPITALVAKMVSELCIAAVVSVAAAVPVFFACRLSGSFAVFAGGFFVTTAVGVSLGHAIAAISPSMDVANAALPALVTMLL